ncbi:MAG: beta-galactosidase, partial [Rhodospirillales bacterium]|nr:beta-galactosidase [Rhodospirillales bacterium]
NGLKVVLCTPTATPPRWMLDRHPDMLPVDAEGRPRGFGSRRHYCFSHQGYRDECVRITRKIAERYGDNPHVVAWQTDNEYGCHRTTLSYSDAARTGFVGWLRTKYGSVERLNQAWGNVFWSMEYGSFEEVGLPCRTVTEPNPAHMLDFHRFSSDQVLSFNRSQVEIIRALSPGRPVAHNFLGRVTEFDHYRVGADMDFVAWDSYPLGFLAERDIDDASWKRRFMRQGDPDYQAFFHDLYRSVGKGRWWVMEQQPGPVNWAPYNPAPLEGMVRLWAWEAFAHGAETVSFFRWRQAPFAQEQMHTGLLRPDSSEARGLIEARQVAAELARAPDVETGPAQVALIFDYESCWAWRIQPQGVGFDYVDLVFGIYRVLRRLGLSVDILPPDADDLSAYKLVAIPGLMHWKDGIRSALRDYRGIAWIGPRTGSKTDDFAIPAPLPPDLPDLLDLRVTHIETVRPDTPIALEKGGAFHGWREFAQVGANAQVLEIMEDGHPALIAQGGLRYVTGNPDQEAAMRILRDICAETGLDILDLPDGLRVRDAGPLRFVFNHDETMVDPADHGIGGEMVLGGFPLPPAGLAVLRR